MDCPVCLVPLVPWFVKEGLAYGRCPRCRGGFAEVPPSEPARYHDYMPELTRTLPEATRKRYQELLRPFEAYRRTGRLLDVGCGGGFFVEEASRAGWKAEGTEVSQSAVDFARSRGLAVQRGILGEVSIPAGSMDVVTVFEVFEHVREPLVLARDAVSLLRPGGALYLTTPNMGSLSRRLLGSDWSVIARDHISMHTGRTLLEICRRLGLRPRWLRSRNILPHEIARLFRGRGGGRTDSGSMEKTVALQAKVDSRPHLRLAKWVINRFLGWTGTGDTLVLLAEKPG